VASMAGTASETSGLRAGFVWQVVPGHSAMASRLSPAAIEGFVEHAVEAAWTSTASDAVRLPALGAEVGHQPIRCRGRAHHHASHSVPSQNRCALLLNTPRWLLIAITPMHRGAENLPDPLYTTVWLLTR